MSTMRDQRFGSEASLRAGVRQLVAKQICLARADLESGEDLAGDLGLDSVAVLELMTALEDAYALPEIPETVLLAITTVRDLEDLVVRYATRVAPDLEGLSHAIR